MLIVAIVMGIAVLALAMSLISISAVALLAQVSALASQCVTALALLAVGGAVVAQMIIRNRIAQIYVARKLLGEDAERLLTQNEPKQLPAAQYEPRPQPVRRDTQTVAVQMITPPIAPSGWGFGVDYDEEE